MSTGTSLPFPEPPDHSPEEASENAYIRGKAAMFLKQGPDVYRRNDFFGEPPAPLDPEDAALLVHGCRQLLEGRGLSAASPLTHLGVFACTDLFRLFHYDRIDRDSTYDVTLDGRKGVLDRITFRHRIHGTEVTYCNFCAPGDGFQAPPVS